MKNLLLWIKNKFFTKSFLSFIIIGILNTLINALFVWLVSSVFTWIHGNEILSTDPLYAPSTAVSTLVAFIAASIFSYFANAKFTYRQNKRDIRTFIEAIISFGIRFGLTWLLTFLFGKLFSIWLYATPLSQEAITTIANLVASILMIPPFYFLLGYVFKRTKKRLENSEPIKEEDGE